MRPTPTPFNTDFLPEHDGHRVCFSEYGNPKGKPLLKLHGGPGSSSKPSHAAGFELDKYRVITFDQRGCGHSQSAGSLQANTTQHLIADMERLREQLEITTWFVAVNSWGATLALAYAQAFPERISGLMLGSLLLGRKRDLEWSMTSQDGVARFFPDLWHHRLEFLDKYGARPENAAQVLLEKLASGSQDEQKDIVAGVYNWEHNLMYALEDVALMAADDVSEKDLAGAKVFLHYEAHQFFLQPNQLLAQAKRIADVPSIIVHGRYDLLCPTEQAWQLHQQLNQSELLILPTSNHRSTAEGKIAQTQAFSNFLKKQLS